MKNYWKTITPLISLTLFVCIICGNAIDTTSQIPMLTKTDETAIVQKTTITTTFKDDRIMINNRLFFPIGIYHDSQESVDWNSTGSKLLNDLKEIANAGFNVIHPEISGNYKIDTKIFNKAQELGIYVLPNFSYKKRLNTIRSYKNQMIILGWDIADDVDHPDNKFNPKQIRKWHEEVKLIDPNRITYISGSYTERIKPFLNSADVVAFQSYPIDNDPNDRKPLRKSYYTMLSVVEQSTVSNRPIFAILQAFPWNKKYPTSQELRNMTYSSLINGVKGIFYYSYFFKGWELSQHKSLWNGIKSIVSEMKLLTPVLLEGSLTKLDTQVDDLYAGQWTHNGNIYVVVLSTSPTNIIEASIKIPITAVGSAQALFPDRPSGMVFTEGQLRGLIQPKDVHIYKLSKKGLK